MSQLTQNTADLDALIAKANALPDAGSGGGGAVETCTVTVTFTGVVAGYGSAGLATIEFSQVASGALTHRTNGISQDTIIITDVPIGTILIIKTNDDMSGFGAALTYQGCELETLSAGTIRGIYKVVPIASGVAITFGA